MTLDPIPANVRQFVRSYIRSVEQLELLLLLRRDRERVWTPAAASRELRTAAGSAQMRLAELARAKLIERAGDGFRFGDEHEHDKVVDDVASCWASYRARFVSLIFERAAL